MASHKQIILLTILLNINMAMNAKITARPVYEVNEQSRMDDKKQSLPNLPYGNPLAENSQQSARLHAQNQQAMFNAERVRQHRAQLQRWTKAPQHTDSYMRAYQESQENHQLALEQQQQVNLQDKKPNPPPKRTRTQQRQEGVKRKVEVKKPEAKVEKSRNHRSYGSVEYHQHLQPKRYHTVYVSPAPTYDQGVTIKPNGNVGLTYLNKAQESKLYTEAIPSDTKYVYPKQYSQMHNYESAQDINALSSLLKKSPQEQVSELNSLILGNEQTEEKSKDVLNTPIDLYFYLKDPQLNTLAQHYDKAVYAQIPQTYANAYMSDVTAQEAPEIKDHTPITEEVDDIEDPNKNRPKPFTPSTPRPIDPTTTKSNNYYKVEVASQTISAGYNPTQSKDQYYLTGQDGQGYQALQYGSQPYYVHNEQTTEGDKSERYLHHNAHPTGVQHLAEDGTGVSAYGDDNLHYAANYEFGYRVRDHHSGNDFGHHEAKKGDKTKGQYHVLLPDGRMQQVKYSAGPEGFHADISYDHLQ